MMESARKDRRKRLTVPAQLILIGLLLVSMAATLLGGQPVSALRDRTAAEPQETQNTRYIWWVMRGPDETRRCTLVIDHPGAPTLGEVQSQCDDTVMAEWMAYQSCTADIAYGEDSPCKHLYLQMASAQYAESISISPFSEITLHQPLWNQSVKQDVIPIWLSVPGSARELNTDNSLALLAGHLINIGAVETSACGDGGLLPNGAAGPCGESAAREEVITWQNQFDDEIYYASLKTDVPAYLLKALIIQESQFWPATTENAIYSRNEYGFGQVTENGADTLLMWNPAFFGRFCPAILGPGGDCYKGYFMLPADQQAVLRGALLRELNADCSYCDYGLDLERAANSIPIVAHTLAASNKQVQRIIKNVTGEDAEEILDYEDLWAFTLANYNGGPWCVNKSFNTTLQAGEKLHWKRVSTHFPDECQGVLKYVDNVIRLYTPEEPEAPPGAQASIITTPTPASSMPVVQATPVGTDPEEHAGIPVPGSKNGDTVEVIVQFKPVLSIFSGIAINAANGERQEKVEGMRNVIVEVPAEGYRDSLDTLQNSWLVAYAEPNAAVQAFDLPEAHQAQLEPVLPNQALAQSEAGNPVIVAVIDTGVDVDHTALNPFIFTNEPETGTDRFGSDQRDNAVDEDRNGYTDDWAGWNFVDDNNLVDDLNGHGTHAAGVILQQSVNTARILPVKALDSSGHGTYAQVAEAIIYATDQGARVINLGFGGATASCTLQEAVDYAYQHGALVVSAAGNTGDATVYYPAGLPRVLAVGAVNDSGQRAPFSNFGEHLSLMAPGVDVTAAYTGGGTATLSGTSVSVAYVSGVAARLAGQPGFDTPDKVRAVLQNTVLDLGQPGKDSYYGFGLVQPDAALAYVISEIPTPVPTMVIDTDPDGSVHTMATRTYYMDFNDGTSLALPSGVSTNTICPDTADQPLNGTSGVGLLGDAFGVCIPGANTDVTWNSNTPTMSFYYNGAGYASAMNVTGTSVEIRAKRNSIGSILTVKLFYTDVSNTKTYFSGTPPTQSLTNARTRYLIDLTGLSATNILAGSKLGVEFSWNNAGGVALAVNSAVDTRALIVDEAPVGANTPPVANDDSYNVLHDTPLVVNAATGVRDNDTDADNDPLTAVLYGSITNGTLDSANPDGSFSFTPTPGFVGTASFTYYANDGTENSAAAATVTITVTNTTPVAVGDNYNVTRDTTLNVTAPGVLGNDTDGDSDSLTAVLDTGVSNGSLTLNSDGSFTYTPNASYTGLDSFTYRANDGVEDSNIVTVNISVNPPGGNNAPIANNDSYSTPVDTPLNVAAPGVLTNDTDGDSDPLMAVSYGSVTNGTLDSSNPDGSFTFTPTPGFNGTASFTYYANDGTENSATPATVTITVGTSNPHGGYGAMTDTCAQCHRTHTAQGPNLIASSLTNNSYCYSCHDGSGVANASSVVSTHSNAAFSSPQEAPFTLLCTQCHDPHGSSNLSAVRPDVRLTTSPITTTGPVDFTARTGAIDSFDDGTSPTNTRICTACHVSNPPSDGMTHTGGANHTGGVNYETEDCTTCHKHDPDGDPLTINLDGFIPSGGSCIGCHASVKGSRRQIVDANSDGTGTGGDFLRASHHMSSLSIPTDADCEVCHDQSAHMGGEVVVKDLDGGASLNLEDGLNNDDAEYAAFCISCHDGTGTSPTVPFSDSVNISGYVIDATAWNVASHYTNANVAGCKACHSNGHGSNKVTMLSLSGLVDDWDHTTDGDPDDPMVQEERFCYNCHSTAGVATIDIQSLYTLPTNWIVAAVNGSTNHNDRHDIALTDQARSTAKIECVDCHDPHVANSTLKVIADPDPNDGRTPGAGYISDEIGVISPTSNWMSDWCMDCHDGSFGPGVTAPNSTTYPLVDIYATWGGNTHGGQGGDLGSGGVSTLESQGPSGETWGYLPDMVVQCMDCHASHTSRGPITHTLNETDRNNYYMLKTTIDTFNGLITGLGDTRVPTSPDPVPKNPTLPVYDPAVPSTWDFLYQYTTNDSAEQDQNWSQHDWCMTCHWAKHNTGKSGCEGCHMHGAGAGLKW